MSISRRDFLKGGAAAAFGLAASGILGACGGDASTTTAAQTTSAPETEPSTTAGAPVTEVVNDGKPSWFTAPDPIDESLIISGIVCDVKIVASAPVKFCIHPV